MPSPGWCRASRRRPVLRFGLLGHGGRQPLPLDHRERRRTGQVPRLRLRRRPRWRGSGRPVPRHRMRRRRAGGRVAADARLGREGGAAMTPAEGAAGWGGGQGDLSPPAPPVGPLHFYDHHRQRYAEKAPIPEAGEFQIGDYIEREGTVGADGEFKITLIELHGDRRWSLYPHLELYGEGVGALR